MAFTLTQLAQIKGGLQLRSDLDALLLSYDAYKVLTSIPKADAEEGTTYNVDELLKALKTSVDGIVGDGEDSLSLPSLAAAIETLQNKPVKDIVKITADYESSAVVLPADFDDLVPSADTDTLYPIYYEDNTPVLDADGQQITINLKTNVLSGVPSVVDASGKDPDNLVYKPVSGDFKFKFYPVGSFTLGAIPEDALLDNQELQAVAYSQAIDKIVTDLAQDQDLIDAIKTLVGDKTVQDQITAITNALGDRIQALEDDNTKVLKADIATTVRDASEAEDTKVASEKAVADAISGIVTDAVNDLDTKIQNNADRLTALETIALPVVDTIAITESAAKTEFILSQVPNSTPVEMVINHFVYYEGDDLTVDRDTKTVTWLGTEANDGFDITPDLTDKVRFSYHTGEFVATNGTYKTIYAAEIPTSGTYNVGDRVINTAPVTGGNEGWICVEAGTPGKWLAYGVVDFENTITIQESAE
jgi:hypothetical protein